MIDHDRLIHELTALDRRERNRKGWNPYALGQYFQAAEGVVDAATFAKAFIPCRGMHRIAKNLGLDLDVQHGQWIIVCPVHPRHN
jgi:hypothetical protein